MPDTTEQTVCVTVMIPRSHRARLEELATEQDRSVSAVLRLEIGKLCDPKPVKGLGMKARDRQRTATEGSKS